MADYDPIYSKKTMDDYGAKLLRLFPIGKIWPKDRNSTLFQLCKGFGTELLRLEDRMLALLRERDSRYVDELLDEAERDLGLPDECYPAAADDDERRARVRAKLINSGGMTPQDYIDTAATFGFTITITEYEPFICGLHGSGHSCGDNHIFFTWAIGVDASESTLELLDSMRCLLERIKPAHTEIVWNVINDTYAGFVDIDSGFDFVDIDGGFDFVDVEK